MLQTLEYSQPATPPAIAPFVRLKRRRAVLKFGSSVLRDHHDLARVAGEIYRQTLHYEQLLIVVSAYRGQTDQLLERFESIAQGSDCAGAPDLVSLGEELTAAQLRTACSRIGVEAIVLRPEQWAIQAAGPHTEAQPVSLQPLPALYARSAVIIVPGFVGLDHQGRRVLLGRGGSDFSALFLAGELEADCVRLYKDVDGVYDHDPALGAEDLHRFDTISWTDCLEIARPLLQPSAIEYAKAKSLRLEVGAIGSAKPTLVTHDTCQARDAEVRSPIRIGLAGFGVVGQALYQRLLCEPDFQPVAILVRDLEKPRSLYPPFGLTDDVDRFRGEDFDVLIDVTCGVEAGYPLTHHQLAAGRAVISANKSVIGTWLDELEQLRQQTSSYLGISACVGGGTPVLETVVHATRLGRIEKVSAVLNGTVNYLLDQLSQGSSFELALSRAQIAGFAEEDPSHDLSGRDAETKLRLIAYYAFGSASEAVKIRRSELTPERIATIRADPDRWIQHATLERIGGGVVGSIDFVRAKSIKSLPKLPAESNFVRLTLADAREIEVVGRGAGGAPTAESIMADLFAWKQQQASARREHVPVLAEVATA